MSRRDSEWWSRHGQFSGDVTQAAMATWVAATRGASNRTRKSLRLMRIAGRLAEVVVVIAVWLLGMVSLVALWGWVRWLLAAG